MRKIINFFVVAALALGLSPASAFHKGNSSAPVIPQLYTLSYGTTFKYDSNYPTTYVQADTFYNTWADDGNIYLDSDDFEGWNNVAPTANTALSTINGYTTSAVGTIVNSMAAWGASVTLGSDNATYKSSGLISIGGVLYKWVSRDIYGNWQPSGTLPEQTILSGQIIKSTNHGTTLTPAPPSTAQPYASPMFTGGPGLNTFTGASFIQYGQNYSGQTADNSNTYVYAISNDGYWNNGNVYYLGHVLISAIGNQSASDWSFYQGGDGSLNVNWGALATATPIISNALKLGLPSIQYVSSTGTYFLFDWYYPSVVQGGNVDPTNSVWLIYEAQHPWGPWFLAQQTTWTPNGLYNPVVVSKSINSASCSFTLFSGGNFDDFHPDGGDYTLQIIPVTYTPCSAMPPPAITFDPATSSLALANGNLTASAASGQGSARDTAASNASGGGAYFNSFIINNDGGGTYSTDIGVLNASQPLTSGSYLGMPGGTSVGYLKDGEVLIGGTTVTTIATYVTGNIVDMAVDFGANLIWFRVNGGSWNNNGSADPTTATGGIDISSLAAGPYYAGITIENSGSVAQTTANFGATPYTYANPSTVDYLNWGTNGGPGGGAAGTCSGGTWTALGGQTIITFTATATLTCTASFTAQVLAVGGGGGGGNGGGGGGYPLYSAALAIPPGSSLVTIGSGGPGNNGALGTTATNGGNTTFLTVTANGGGAGGDIGVAGANGGNGGGGGTTTGAPGGIGNPGNNGGAGFNGGPPRGAGGGGGGGSAGQAATSSTGGNGGAGLAFTISGASVLYGPGGGGSINGGGTSAGGGGSGGGGGGDNNGSGPTAATGIGAGGGGADNVDTGGSGTPGIVILACTTGHAQCPTQTGGSGCTGAGCVLASRVQSLVTSLGFNTHIYNLPGTYTAANINADTAYLGVYNIRDYGASAAPSTYATIAQAGGRFDANEGTAWNSCPGGGGSTASYLAGIVSSLNTLVTAYPGSNPFVEGPNEINNQPVCYLITAVSTGHSGTVINFSGGVPLSMQTVAGAGYGSGVVVTDATNSGAIPANTTLVSATSTSVTLSASTTITNGDTIDFTANQTNPASGIAWQQDIFTTVHGDATLAGTPVLNFTDNPIYGIAGTADYNNIHFYPTFGSQPLAEFQYGSPPAITGAFPISGAPLAITEFGYFTMVPNTGGATDGVDQTTQARYALDGFMDYNYNGVLQTYFYDLIDDACDPGNTNAEDHYGIFDCNNNPKTLAVAIKNFVTLLHDSNGTALTFTPGSLNYSVSGLSAVNTGSSNYGGYQKLYQDSSGNFYIVLWNEANAWYYATNSEVPVSPSSVTITLGTSATTVDVYEPIGGTSPIATLSGVTSIPITLGADLQIVKIVSSGGSGSIELTSEAGNPLQAETGSQLTP